jgi:hypothetical protein
MKNSKFEIRNSKKPNGRPRAPSVGLRPPQCDWRNLAFTPFEFLISNFEFFFSHAPLV